MSDSASRDGTNPNGAIFNDSAATIRVNLSDGIDLVDFKGIDRLRLIDRDL
jgi:hypothetical protein